MNLKTATRLVVPLLFLAAAPVQAAPPPGFNPHRIAFKPGTYRCELGQHLQIRTVSADQQTAVLQWRQRDYTLRAVDARSGALRYEDASSGLVWLMIHGKSMLLDARQGQRLADACRT
jgi:hypothetical protein